MSEANLKLSVKTGPNNYETIELPTRSSIDAIKTEVMAKNNIPRSKKSGYYLFLNDEFVLELEFKKLSENEEVKATLERGEPIELSLVTEKEAKDIARRKKDGSFVKTRGAIAASGSNASISGTSTPAPAPTAEEPKTSAASSESSSAPSQSAASSSASSSHDADALKKIEGDSADAQNTIRDLQDKLKAAERRATDLEEKTKSQERRIRELEDQLKNAHTSLTSKSDREAHLARLQKEDEEATRQEEERRKKIQADLQKLKDEEEEEEKNEKRKADERRKEDDRREEESRQREKDDTEREKKRKDDDDKRKKEDDDRRKKDEEDRDKRKKEDEEREKKRKDDDDRRKKKEDEERDKKRKEDEEKRQRDDDDRRKKEDEDRDKKRKEEDDKRKKEDDDRRKKEEEEKSKPHEETHKPTETAAAAQPTTPRGGSGGDAPAAGFREPVRSAADQKLPLKIGGLIFEDRYEIKNTMEATFPSSAYSGWVLVGYTNKAGNQLALSGSFPGGDLETLLPYLKDDQIQYAILRIPNESTKSMSGKSKDILLSWVGSSVGTIEKGKKTSHIGDVQKVVQPFHIILYANSGRANLTMENIYAALAAGKNSV